MSNKDDELKKALDQLEAFKEASEKKESRLDKIADLVQGFFSSDYKEKKAELLAEVKKELIKSIGVIKTYLPLLDKYREGTPEQRKLAEFALKTIEDYNQVLSAKEEGSSLKIEVHPSVQKFKTSQIDDLFKSNKSHAPSSQEERDTLRMKAIRLIESQMGPREEGSKVEGEIAQVNEEGKMVTLVQTWSELPGEITRIVGAFRRESNHSIPIKDSFQLYLESIQPGHPYPPQNMGWSLSHWLVPSSVLWIDQIPLLKPILERKKQAAIDLLPKGKKNLRARRYYRFKKDLFENLKLEYLSFHQELAHSIVRSHPLADDASHDIINRFYEYLGQESDAFELLSQTNDKLNRLFIDTPFETVEEIRINHLDNRFFESDKEKSLLSLSEQYRTARESLTFDEKEPIRSYLSMMGNILGDSAQNLMMMQLSEKLQIKPPHLSDFDLKIQAASFKHLIEFLDELDLEMDLMNPHEKEAMIARMRTSIHAEIELFDASDFDKIDPYLQELVDETVSYFHAQYHAK